jgi:hypothetical protein
VEIELLFWRGCPSYPEAQELVESVAGGQAEVRLHEVHTQEEAEELEFPGSPTIRVDGVDVDPAGAQTRAMLACRIYRLPDGKVSPVPSREMLEAAIR